MPKNKTTALQKFEHLNKTNSTITQALLVLDEISFQNEEEPTMTRKTEIANIELEKIIASIYVTLLPIYSDFTICNVQPEVFNKYTAFGKANAQYNENLKKYLYDRIYKTENSALSIIYHTILSALYNKKSKDLNELLLTELKMMNYNHLTMHNIMSTMFIPIYLYLKFNITYSINEIIDQYNRLLSIALKEVEKNGITYENISIVRKMIWCVYGGKNNIEAFEVIMQKNFIDDDNTNMLKDILIDLAKSTEVFSKETEEQIKDLLFLIKDIGR